ncbi:MAG: HPF/RaiA family ribosome-associated protein [Muribaculaceae bacterium]|nr:HPF/RaiA family ribosome-associated protein [Muribaculaceae bacterium]MDE5958667.1 HPF/RaiA family ribosome-associated protein [Muribaculaceae bacterium]MDE5972710.1 HPF/RaiA family ribosome-associated protein [Muribaculaceae bacterium]MDE6462809.1 HPF/RaiA family ribosome-associated protein [Muribaculaceae bacterium]MDE6509596.1 HPF/RaiA family ribosome-associated protein [Muribaculaceae bacterium]
METKIQAIHFDASEALVNFINKKVEKLVRKSPYLSEVSVTMRVVKPETSMNKEVKFVALAPQRAEVVATKVADTFEEAVDLCVAALEPQVEKLKEKK